MKFKATIFVEGVADMRFICDFVKKRFNYSLREHAEVQPIIGKDSIGKFIPNFQQSSSEFTNLVVFDANGDIEKRRNELNQKRDEFEIDFEEFLVPNNKDKGDLETLLENIIHQNTRPVLKCIDDFVKCLDIIPARPFQTPNQKSKIYLYASLLTTNEEAKEKNRTYLNQEIWNLESVYLNPLFEFLQPHFINE